MKTIFILRVLIHMKMLPDRVSAFFLKAGFALACIFSISLGVQAGPAKTVYSKSNPSVWTTNSHWSSTSGGGSCTCTPDESKDVIYVETNTNSAAGLTFGASATITVRNNSVFTINGDVIFTNGSIVVVEAGSSLVITGNLINNNNSNQVTINGGISVGGNFDGGNGSAILGVGTMTVTGTATTTGSGTVFGSNGSCTGCEISPSTPLPVEFLSLEAKPNGKVVDVNWSTAVEMNSDYFMVQRSQGVLGFEDLSPVKAAGNSSMVVNYSSVDSDPYSGISYYRLKQVDLDGKFSYSTIVAVNLNPESTFEVYPNPTSGPFHISVSGTKGEKTTLVIRDMLGKEFLSEAILLNSDLEILSVDASGKLASGIYTVEVNSGRSLQRKKIIIR